MKNTITVFIVLGQLLLGCTRSKYILDDRDYEVGDWLLVNFNHAKKTIELIDDEAILQANARGLFLKPIGDCSGTTCDGFISLFEDGKLIAGFGYDNRSGVFESEPLKKAYKKGLVWGVEPVSEADFTSKWDSLRKAKMYPTVLHTQPADKDIIEAYKIIEE